MRSPVNEIIEFNKVLLGPERRVHAQDGRELTAEAMGKKLEALAKGAFPFFRGTFHLMARDLLQQRVPLAQALAPEGLIVGDLHLENFGAYRGSSGQRCFDVNDFDDVGFGPVDLDLKRLCTSAMLLPGLDAGARTAASKAIAHGWLEGIVRMGGRFPVRPLTADKAEPPVKELLAAHTGKPIAALDPPKSVAVEPRWTTVVEAAIEEWRQNLEQLKAEVPKGKVEGVAYRFRGTGSLGRLRFWAVLGHGEGKHVVELKEARPSQLDACRLAPGGAGRPSPAGAHVSNPAGLRARMQAASIRRLQGDPWPSIAGTHLNELPALARLIEPDDEKIASDRFAGPKSTKEELIAYAGQCGEVLARIHVRESAPQLLSAGWDAKAAADGAVEFAKGYAKTVEADFAAFVKAAAHVRGDLGLQPGAAPSRTAP